MIVKIVTIVSKQVVSLTQATTIILLVENRVGSKVAIGRNWQYIRTIYFQTFQLFFWFCFLLQVPPSLNNFAHYIFFPQEVRFTVEMPPAPQPRSSQDQEVKSYFQILILVQTGSAYFSKQVLYD